MMNSRVKGIKLSHGGCNRYFNGWYSGNYIIDNWICYYYYRMPI